jgi:hypothetical protein
MTEPDHIPIARAVGTVRLASEFVSAASRQDLDHSSPPSFVIYFLLGHSIELALKAVLIAYGTSERTLRDLGHDLMSVLTAVQDVAPPESFHLDAGDRRRIEATASLYRAKAFEYLQPGFASLPLPRDLFGLAERLVTSIGNLVEAHVRDALATNREEPEAAK